MCHFNNTGTKCNLFILLDFLNTFVGNTSSPPVNGTSRPPRVTTIGAPATTVATPPEPRIKLGFRLRQNFTAELSNQSSPQFQTLKGQVASAVSLCNLYSVFFFFFFCIFQQLYLKRLHDRILQDGLFTKCLIR